MLPWFYIHIGLDIGLKRTELEVIFTSGCAALMQSTLPNLNLRVEALSYVATSDPFSLHRII